MVSPRPSVPPFSIDAVGARAWSPLSLEARLLAGSLRSVPVTLLHGSDATDGEGLLTLGVMPLLGRRREDQAAPTRRARVLPFPDRRRALGRGAAPVELVLLIDDWPAPPLQPLAARIEHAQALSAANDPGTADGTPGRVLLVMRNFEAALAAAASALHPDRFWLELAQALRSPAHGLHLLLITQEAVTPALRWLGQHVPELGEQGLLLQPGVDPQLAPVAGFSGDADSAAEPASTVPPISDQEWLAAVQGAVERAARRGGAPKSPVAAPHKPPGPALPTPALRPGSERAAAPVAFAPSLVPVRGPVPGPVAEPVSSARTAPSLGDAAARLLAPAANPASFAAASSTAKATAAATHPAAAMDARRSAPLRLLLPVLAAAACAALAGWWSSRGSFESAPATVALAPATTRPAAATEPQRIHGGATPPATPNPPAPVPPLPPVASEPGSDLRRLLAGLPLLDLRGEPAQMAARLSAAQSPTLALVRYDAMQRLPASGGLESLRMVAPLFVEPVQVWVRGDSPQRRLDALARGVVDVGRDGGDEATAVGVTEALFGKPLPAARRRRLSDDQALAALQRGEVDAVLRVQASRLTAMATASVAQGGLQTLTLDRTTPAGVRALREYLPATTATAAGPGRAGNSTLGVMSFLIVQGRDGPARERLAGDALRALCTGLPALRSAAAPAWAAVRPEVQLPAGRPYALSADEITERIAPCGPGRAQPIDVTSNSPNPKGSQQ